MKGLTLIEILIVGAIIAIVSIMAISSLTSQTKKATDAKIKSDLSKIQTFLEDYEKDKDCYPDTLPACGDIKIPCNPTTKLGYEYIPRPTTSSCKKYYYMKANLQATSVEYIVSSPNAPTYVP